MVPRWRFFATFLRPVFSARSVQHISDLHSKFALRPHHVWKYMVDIQSPTAEIRRGNKKRRRKKKQDGTIYIWSAVLHRCNHRELQQATPCAKSRHATYRSLRLVHPSFSQLTLLSTPPKHRNTVLYNAFQ